MRQAVENTSKILTRFLLSQYFSDGLRITLGVLLPSIICYNLNMVETGIAISLGALCAGIPDNPGPFEHRRNAMLITIALTFLTALATGLLAQYPVLLVIYIGASCFVFSMLHVFGARAAAVGIAVLVIMVLGIDQQAGFVKTLQYALMILGGGIWYFLLALLSQKLLPYRAAEQILGECIFQVAAYIRIKAGFYDPEIKMDEQYRKIIEQQAVVNEYQEHVRQILFKTRKILTDSTQTGRVLLLTFVDLVDLYEQSMATHYDYDDIRKTYKHTGILNYFSQVIEQIAEELEHIGTNMHNHHGGHQVHHFGSKLTLLKQKIDEAEQAGLNMLVLKRILVNLRNMSNRLERIYSYKTNTEQLPEHRGREFDKFVQHQEIDWKLLKANLTFKSNHFRHASRMALVCMAAFIFSKTIYQTPYSYWILLTIIVILKPGFSLTKQRNIERLTGTIGGGIIGLLVLRYFPSVNERFIFLTAFMLLSYSFMRIRYVVSVLFMTPYVLIVFSFTGTDTGFSVAWERIIDTIIGATAAFLASYFVFPNWESYQLKNVMSAVISANMNYLKSIVERDHTPLSQSNYKLARKELYVQSSNLATAFQRMLSEPKSKQRSGDDIFKFTVISTQLSSYFATLSSQLKPGEGLNDEQKKWIRSVYFSLSDALEKTGVPAVKNDIRFAEGNTSVHITQEFLEMIHQTVSDLKKYTPGPEELA